MSGQLYSPVALHPPKEAPGTIRVSGPQNRSGFFGVESFALAGNRLFCCPNRSVGSLPTTVSPLPGFKKYTRTLPDEDLAGSCYGMLGWAVLIRV